MPMPTQRIATATVLQVSECFIQPYAGDGKPDYPSVPLTMWDYGLLSFYYIQKGLFFSKPPPSAKVPFSIISFLDDLKQSLSLILVDYYPLAGRFATRKTDNPPSYIVCIDFHSGPGARVVHATVDLVVDDILKATYVPDVVQSFFDHDKVLNHEGIVRPLLTIQVTELTDGIFVGCSMNHAVGDGTSFWNFFNSFSEVFLAVQEGNRGVPLLSHPPSFDREFLKEYLPSNGLPYTQPDQFLRPFNPPLLKERVFHISSESIAKLKDRVQSELCTQKPISSLQAVSALVWRSLTRARHLPAGEVTSCWVACNNRTRMTPPVSENYFGNCVTALCATATIAELLDNNLRWAASKIHDKVAEHSAEKVRQSLEEWTKSPRVYQFGQFGPCSVLMGSSPRFNKYGVQFGLGRALALRSGFAHKFCGKVSLYPGAEGGASMDLETCLAPQIMDAVESDKEFVEFVSLK